MIDICLADGCFECVRCRLWGDDRRGCRYERVSPPADHGTASLVTGTVVCGDCNEGMALAGEVSHA